MYGISSIAFTEHQMPITCFNGENEPDLADPFTTNMTQIVKELAAYNHRK